MYLTPIGIIFAANITVTCPYLCLFNFVWWHHASDLKQLIHAIHPTMVCGKFDISFWFVCVGLFSALAACFVMKCVKMHCCLPHNPIAARFLHLCACFTCSSVHVSTLHPLLAHHYLCSVDVNCVFFRCILWVFFSVHVLLFCFCGYCHWSVVWCVHLLFCMWLFCYYCCLFYTFVCNHCYALKMITVVIETFARCQLYRLLWLCVIIPLKWVCYVKVSLTWDCCLLQHQITSDFYITVS